MKKKEKKKPPEVITVKTNLSFEQLMGKALHTPLPIQARKSKKKK